MANGYRDLANGLAKTGRRPPGQAGPVQPIGGPQPPAPPPPQDTQTVTMPQQKGSYLPQATDVAPLRRMELTGGDVPPPPPPDDKPTITPTKPGEGDYADTPTYDSRTGGLLGDGLTGATGGGGPGPGGLGGPTISPADDGDFEPDPYDGFNWEDYLPGDEDLSFDPTRELMESQMEDSLRRHYESMAARGMAGSGAAGSMAGGIMRGYSQDIASEHQKWMQENIDNKMQMASMIMQDDWHHMDLEHQKLMAHLMFELDRKRMFGDDYDPTLGMGEFQMAMQLLANPNLSSGGKKMLEDLLSNIFGEDMVSGLTEDDSGIGSMGWMFDFGDQEG